METGERKTWEEQVEKGREEVRERRVNRTVREEWRVGRRGMEGWRDRGRLLS